MRKRTFEQWMMEVNAYVKLKFNWLDVADLPDINYHEMYERGASAKSAATKALKNAFC